MRKIKTVPGQYYHIYNKSSAGKAIFNQPRDYVRFLFLLFVIQSPKKLLHTKRQIDFYIKHSKFKLSKKDIQKITNSKKVEIVAFVIMPNHFHIIINDLEENGISLYMQRLQSGYARYSQIKYKSSGHLFRGPFGLVPIEDNEQLLYLSSYIHKNPKELISWKDNFVNYPWSSYQDFVKENRWGKLLKPEIVTSQFKSNKDYSKYVISSVAKENIM